jgi:hypothetical protein
VRVYTVFTRKYTTFLKEFIYSILHTVYCIQYIAYSILHTVYCTQYIVYSILHTVYCTQYIAYSILYTVYCTQYIAYHPGGAQGQPRGPFVYRSPSLKYALLVSLINLYKHTGRLAFAILVSCRNIPASYQTSKPVLRRVPDIARLLLLESSLSLTPMAT